MQQAGQVMSDQMQRPASAALTRSRPDKAPDLHPMERRNWIIHLHFVRKEYDQCLSLIKEQLQESDGMCEHALYTQGLILRSEGKLHQAFESFQRCRQLNPLNTDNLKQVARSLFLLGKFEMALTMYDQTEKECSGSPDWEVLYHKGMCHMRMKDVDAARASVQKSLAVHQYPGSYQLLGQIAIQQNDVPTAIEVYQQAVRNFPEDADLLVALGMLYIETGQHQEAFEQLGTALAYQPEHTAAIMAAGSIIQTHGDYDVALSKYRLAARNVPESAPLWNNIAMCFFGKKKYVASISCLKRAISYNPFDWKALYNLGLVHLTMQQYASAFHFLSAAVNLNADSGPIYSLLAVALAHLDDPENADQAYRAALQADVDDPSIPLNYAIFMYNSAPTRASQIDQQMAEFSRRLEAAQSAGNAIEHELIDASARLQGALRDSRGTEKSSSAAASMADDEV